MLKYFRSIIGFVISGIALVYFSRYLPKETIHIVFSNNLIFFYSITCLIPAYFFRALKYRELCKGLDHSASNLSMILFAGIALNNLLPLRLGDVFRISYTYKIEKFPLKFTITTIFLERIFDLLTILILLTVFLSLFYSSLLMEFIKIYYTYIFVFILLMVLLTLSKVIRRLYLRFKSWVLDELSLNYKDYFKITFYSTCQWLIEIFLLALIISSIFPEPSYYVSIFSTFFCNLSTLIPSAPGYIGTFEAVGLIPFQLTNFSQISLASIFIIFLHGSIWIFSTFLGLACLIYLFFIKTKSLYK